MNDKEYMEKFEEYYNNPDRDALETISDLCKDVDILKVSAMQLATAAGPWDNDGSFDQALIDCNDLLDLYAKIRNLSNDIQERLEHYVKYSSAYFKLAEDLLKEIKEREDTGCVNLD